MPCGACEPLEGLRIQPLPAAAAAAAAARLQTYAHDIIKVAGG